MSRFEKGCLYRSLGPAWISQRHMPRVSPGDVLMYVGETLERVSGFEMVFYHFLHEEEVIKIQPRHVPQYKLKRLKKNSH